MHGVATSRKPSATWRSWSACPRSAEDCTPPARETDMATLRIPKEETTITDPVEVRARLAAAGITHKRWRPSHPVAADAAADEVLRAYAQEIDLLKQEGGYVTADVIDVKPDTPGLDAMLAKFRREHWHDEDEVRFILEGRGLCHNPPRAGGVPPHS